MAVLNSELRLLDSVRQMVVLLKEIFEAEVDVDKIGLQLSKVCTHSVLRRNEDGSQAQEATFVERSVRAVLLDSLIDCSYAQND